MVNQLKKNHTAFLLTVGLSAWLIPGAGHWILNERKRAVIICVGIVITFLIGLYIGSIGVIDPVGAKPWYVAQIMNTPAVAFLGSASKSGNYPVFAKASEIGQIYTSVSGMLNLLCIINAIYIAHLQAIGKTEA